MSESLWARLDQFDFWSIKRGGVGKDGHRVAEVQIRVMTPGKKHRRLVRATSRRGVSEAIERAILKARNESASVAEAPRLRLVGGDRG